MRVLMWLRTGLFLSVLVCPLALMLRQGRATINEKRTLAAMPALSSLDKQYPERFDAYFRDHFGGRDRLIHWNNRLKYTLFRESPVDYVIVGRNGWLFYSAEIDIRNFAGRWPHSSADIDTWLNRQDERERQYAAEGARYLIVVVPDKQTVYSESVPYRYGPQAPGVLDEILARLEFHPRLRLLDLRPALLRHKDTELYYKTDQHWNSHGAFVAAQAITDVLRPDLPNIGTLRREDYDVR
jgi:alginate O-acetyltransferase complex protein AlgJ